MYRYEPLIPLDEVVRRYSLRLLVLFGSYDTPRENADSDIDLAWLGNNPLSFSEQEALLHDLILHFRKAEMDLIDLTSADPIIRATIAQEGRVIYEEEPGLFDRMSLFYIKQRMDLNAMIEERMQQIGRHIREELRHAGKRSNLHET